MKQIHIKMRSPNSSQNNRSDKVFNMTSRSSLTLTEMPSANALHQSIVNQDLETIKRILEGQQSWKVIDNQDETVLHLAFKCKNNIPSIQESIIHILQCFLNEGLSVNVKNAVGRTVLFQAVENRLQQVTDYLVQHGANLNAQDQSGNSIVHLLIEDQFKRYYENWIKNGKFTLKQHVEQIDIKFINWLLSKGVDADIQNNNGKTALHLAIERNLQHVMPTLIKYMNAINYIDENGCTIIESFFKAKANTNAKQAPVLTYISRKCYESRYDNEIFSLLLERGVSVDHVNDRGNTLVHEFLKSYDSNPMIGRMVELYTNVNAQDRDGNTALHLVIRDSLDVKGHHKKHTMDVVRSLLFKGANVNLKNNFGDTTVALAVRVRHVKVVKALLLYGADVSPSANPRALFLHGISNVSSIEDEMWAPIVDTLVHAGWNINEVRPDDHSTPLMEACRSRCPVIAQKLIDNGANVNYVVKQSLMRPIHVAAMFSHANQSDRTESLFKMLAKAGALVNVKNKRGEMAIHLAAHCDYFAMRRLLNLGAHVDVRDNAGCLPLHNAIEKRNVQGIIALLKHGANINDEGVLIEFDVHLLRDRYYNIENPAFDYLMQHWLKLKAANLPVIDGYAVLSKK